MISQKMATSLIDYDGSGSSDPSDDEVTDQTTVSPESNTFNPWQQPQTQGPESLDPKKDLIEASLGTSEGTDQATGSQVLAGGGATTAAGVTASQGVDVDPSASRNVAESTERMVEGDDPDVDPDEAFERAQAAKNQQSGGGGGGVVEDVPPAAILLALGAAAVVFGGA